jgi:hypothetical protein
MSPIPEMNSSKGTNYSATQFNDDNRKLTGTGQYNLDKVDDDEEYSDDFESVSSDSIADPWYRRMRMKLK